MTSNAQSEVSWTIADSWDQFASLSDEWMDLAMRAQASLPYCGPHYVLATMAAYHSNDKPVVIAARHNDQLCGVLPLVARPLRRFGVTIREIGFPCNPNVINSGPLIYPGNEVAPTDIACALLDGAFAGRADSLILDHMPNDGRYAGIFSAAADR